MDHSVGVSDYKQCSKAETQLPARIQEKNRPPDPRRRRDWSYRGRHYHTRQGNYQNPEKANMKGLYYSRYNPQ